MLQAFFGLENGLVMQAIGFARRMPIVAVIGIKVVFHGDAKDARIKDRRAVGQFPLADTDDNVFISIVRPNAKQVESPIAVVALGTVPDDDS